MAYHSSKAGAIDPKLADQGINAVSFANGPVPVANELDRILDVIRNL